MRPRDPKPSVRAEAAALVTLLTPELGLHAAMQVSSHSVQVIRGDMLLDPAEVLADMLAKCHLAQHGSGPRLERVAIAKLTVECLVCLRLAEPVREAA